MLVDAKSWFGSATEEFEGMSGERLEAEGVSVGGTEVVALICSENVELVLPLLVTRSFCPVGELIGISEVCIAAFDVLFLDIDTREVSEIEVVSEVVETRLTLSSMLDRLVLLAENVSVPVPLPVE
ncbi:hypothetical protein AA313_de0207241 [Arthrobotrys entomopaga]|nr:hypothetical protein AA313_de0207241 [Arthrobotrys entomopaga]